MVIGEKRGKMLKHKPMHLEDELCFAVHSAQKLYSRFYTAALKNYGLTYVQYTVLLVLWEERRPMMVKELGERLRLDSGTLTPLLNRLERQGWVSRNRDSGDARCVMVELTKKSAEAEHAVKRHIQDCVLPIDMTEGEYRECIDVLNEISGKLELINGHLSG